MDNRYAAPQLLALMLTNHNIRAVGTCKAYHKGFNSDALQLLKDAAIGEFKRLYDKRLGMVIMLKRFKKTADSQYCHEAWDTSCSEETEQILLM